MNARYVVVTGAVGAGATTIANVLMSRWRADALLEGQIETLNPFFADAQGDPHRWQLASQAHFLAASAARHQQLAEKLSTTSADLVVEDRTPFEHHGAYVLASHELGYLSDREHDLLGDLAGAIEPSYLVPDVLVYREMTEDQLVDRVVGRGRQGESADYEKLRVIHRAFDTFAAGWDRSPLVRIPAELDVLTPSGEVAVVDALTAHLGAPSE